MAAAGQDSTMAHDHLPVEHQHPDAWHAHALAEGAPQQEHGKTQNYVIIGAVTVAMLAILVVTILGTIMFTRTTMTGLRGGRVESMSMSDGYQKYRDESKAALTAYSWASPDAAKDGTRVSIPIDAAKQRVIEKYAARK